MAAPATPTNFTLQQGNAQVLLMWNLVAGATSYKVYRSTDQVTYSLLASPAVTSYVDTTALVSVQYWYKLAANNVDGDSPQTAPQSIIPTPTAQMSLGGLRLLAQQRADRVNSDFVTLPEWNVYLNQSAYELYDLLITVYEDYFLAPPVEFQTDGTNDTYALPDGVLYTAAPPFYKLMGVDLGLANNGNAWVTLRKFQFISRNRYVYPNISSTYLGVFNMQYRVMGNNIKFIPVPASAQFVRLWYIPRLRQMLLDTDLLDGVSGWSEYVVVDAAIKALKKEESDTSELMAEKQALIKRINDTAEGRDVGQPDVISNTRSWSERWGSNFGPGFDGQWGGY